MAADLRPDASLVDVFRALFPCGSVTGAPKVSTMGIIAALEHDARGVYCGTVGYLAPDGAPGPRARFNVAIRTVVHDAETGDAAYGVGGGITWDSQAAAEYDETVAKARVLTERRPPLRLLETLAHEPGSGYRRLEDHRARLRSSADYLGIEIDEAAITRGVGSRSGAVSHEGGAGPPRWSTVTDASRSGRRRWRTCANRFAWRSTATIRSTPPIRCCSTRPRCAGGMNPRATRFPDADDVVLVNTRGDVTETTRANIAVRRDGRWVTPPIEAGLLPGCERAALLADGTLVEERVTVGDLEAAEDVAFLNSVRGWRRAVLVEQG